MDYFTDKNTNELKSANDASCNGFMILFDIKESTRRKKQYKPKWVKQTETLYSAFSRLCKGISDNQKIDEYVVKYKGDGLMAFFKTGHSVSESANERPSSVAAEYLLGQIAQFLDEVTISMGDFLCEMRLKTVICYLTGIYLIRGDDGTVNDALGRGVDFAHRLEQYGDASHLVVNEMFFKSIQQDNKHTVSVHNKNSLLNAIKCEKVIKGWDGVQTFWVLTNTEMLEFALTDIAPSPYDHDVMAELFNFYIGEERLSKQSTNGESVTESPLKDWRKK